MSLLNPHFLNVRISFIFVIAICLIACSQRKEQALIETPEVSKLPAYSADDSFVGLADSPPIENSHEQEPDEIHYPEFTVMLDNIPAKSFLQALAQDAELDLVINGDIKGNVTMAMKEKPLPEILNSALRQFPFRYQLSPGLLVVFDDKPYSLEYSVPFLNLQRHSDSSIRLSTQLDSVSVSVSGDSTGLSSSNNSDASIVNESHHRFWDSLEQDLRTIVSRSDSKSNEPVPLIVNRESGVLLVYATQRIHQEVGSFLESVIASIRRQVLIEALVVEVSLNTDYQAGVDWRVLSDGNKAYAYAQSLSGSPVVSSVNANEITSPNVLLSVFNNTSRSVGISATLTLLEQFGDVKILSSPKINAMNNQAAVLKVVDNKVYFSVGVQRLKAEDQFEKLSTTTEIKTVPIGLVMNVIPFISEENTIILNVRPTISRILGFVADPNRDLAAAGVKNLVPEIQVREMESVLRVDNGGTVVIGGLMQDRSSHNQSGVPFFSKIPVIGHLFQFQKEKKEKTELLVFLKPTIIRSVSNYNENVIPYLN